MQRYAQVIKLHAADEEEYIRIRNYSIFLRSGVLFAYFEYHGSDYAADMRKMAADPETQRWWKITDAMQAQMEDAAPGEKWSPLREVFHFDGPAN